MYLFFLYQVYFIFPILGYRVLNEGEVFSYSASFVVNISADVAAGQNRHLKLYDRDHDYT